MTCKWCGTGGAVVDGYHPGCLDAKDRVAQDRSELEAKIKQKRSSWRKPTSERVKVSPGYAAQVADFRERMARRGIKI